MQIRSIPQFIDTKNLTITRQGAVDEEQLHTQIQAVDPQGDSITISRQQEPSGPACVMPRVQLTVSYAQANQEPEKARQIGSDEAGDLYSSLQHAQKAENVDPMGGMWIMSDLAQKGGMGGAC